MPNSKLVRMRSVRAARRGIEEAIFHHKCARITSQQLNAIVGAYRAWVEVFIAEKQMVKLGLHEEDDLTLSHNGDDGGFHFSNPRVMASHKRVTKSGSTAKGDTYDEETETQEYPVRLREDHMEDDDED